MRRMPVFVLALAGLLATTVAFSPAAQAATHTFRTTLGGANEVPPTGSAVTGSVLVTVDDGSNTVCSYLALENIDVVDIVAMHIHDAPTGVNGPVVVPFSPVAPSVCTGGVDAGLIAALVAAPDQYYFNIHTAAYPAGEARGQLEPVTPGLPTPLTGGLSGAAEVPPNGTPTAGVVGVLVDSGTNLVCVAFSLQNQALANITAMHIHQAPAGANGSIVIPFLVENSACSLADAGVVADMIASPTDFYFNIHSAAYPGGEARAQLSYVVVPMPTPQAEVPMETPVEPQEVPTADPVEAPTEAVAAEAVTAQPRYTG